MRKFPAFYLLIVISFGVLLLHFINISIDESTIYGSIIFGVILIIFPKTRHISYYIFALSLSFYLYSSISVYNLSNRKYFIGTDAIIKGEVIDIIKDDSSFTSLILDADIDLKYYKTINSDLLLNLYKVDNESYEVGDILLAKSKINLPKKKIFNNDFDEESYSKYLGVSFIAKSNTKNITKIKHNKSWKYYHSKLNDNLFNYLNEYINDKDALAIVYALVSGNKSNIEKETKRIFSLSGTAHLLAISGLHVGFFALFLHLFLPKVKFRSFSLFIFIILVILFVIFTGLHASAIRAGIMAILYKLIIHQQRKANHLNILSFTFLIFVIISPTAIYDIGFQLSFLCMLAIILVAPRIYRLFNYLLRSTNKIIKYIYLSLSISIAINISTFPVLIYHFNSFSLLSLLANIIEIPLITIAVFYLYFAILISIISVDLSGLYLSLVEILIQGIIETNNILVHLDFLYFENIHFEIVFLLISISIIYLLFSYSINQFLFRLSSITMLFLLFSNYSDKSENQIHIVPRDKYVLVSIKSNEKKYLLISDRRAGEYPYKSNEIIKLIDDSSDYKIGITGNISEVISNEIISKRFYLSLEDQNRISKMLGLKEEIYQVNLYVVIPMD